MKTLFKVTLGIFVALFVISCAFGLIGTLIGLTFGLLGTAMGIVWRVVSNPMVLIVIILLLAYMLNKKTPL